MQYTFEITIAGCATNCAHCYVDGGPGAIMSVSEYRLCLQKLVPALERLQGDISLNLGNETFCHPQVAELFRLTDQICPQFFDRCGEDFPTTGVALLRHREREAILQELHRKGIGELFFAVHGNTRQHDAIVGRKGRFEQLFETADFLTERGFEVGFSLMLSSALIPGLEEVLDRIRRYSGANIHPVVPLYCPTPRLRAYQNYRLEKHALLQLCDRLDAYFINTVKVRSLCANCSEQAMWSTPKNFAEERKNAPNWAFFHVDRDLKLYYGNAGMHTRLLGDLHHMTTQQVFDAIAPLGANYDFDAFYPMEAFEQLHRMPRPKTDLVYPSRADCYYAWLDEMGIQNLLLK